jgi:hypothetical protein
LAVLVLTSAMVLLSGPVASSAGPPTSSGPSAVTVVTATGAGFGGVSCPSAKSCTAVGSFDAARTGTSRTLAEHWDGTAWFLQRTLDIRANAPDGLGSVSCTSRTQCFAVGTTGFYLSKILIEEWNGALWSVLADSNPGGADDSALRSVSCAAANACMAVGDENFNTGVMPAALTERWDGRRWVVVPSAVPSQATSYTLNGVSCLSSTNCTAVGDFGEAGGVQRTLAERFDGTTWSVQAMPSPAPPDEPVLLDVSCAGLRCMALGSDYTSTGVVPLAETFDGSSWSIVPLAAPAGFPSFELGGIDCTTSSACVAVGSEYDTTTGTVLALVETWNGVRWAVVPPGALPNAAGAVLESVSCASRGSCMAVGQLASGSARTPLALMRSDGSWTMVPPVTP